MNTCRVQGCRFKTSHVASAHRCGVCEKFGHGEIECGNQRKMYNLTENSKDDKLIPSAHCDLKHCDYRWSHSSSAHHCRKCGERAHCETECPQNRRRHRRGSIFSRWEADSIMMAENVESEDVEEKKDMDDDEVDEMDEETKPASKYVVKCPSCRKYNVFTDLKKVFVDSQCVACMDDKAQVLFPVCSHICVCITCCGKMNEHEEKGDIFPSSNSSSSSSSSFFPDDDEGSYSRACDIMGTEEGKVYVSVPAGMGCSFWYRRNSQEASLERLFMHSDDWGQYGAGRVEEHSAFIAGYRQVT